MKTRWLWSGILLCLLTVFAVNAQTATQSIEASADYVVQAWTSFTQLESYHFTYDSVITTELTGENKALVSATTTLYSAEGDAVAGGDNHTMITVKPGSTDATKDTNPSLQLERIVADGITYINLQLADAYADIFNVDAGWWRYEDMRQALDNPQTAFALNNFVQLPLPSELPLSGSLILSVQEQESETLDDQAIRVFDIELNALKIMLQESPVTGQERLTELLQQVNMLASSRLSAKLRLWIGADDGLVYRGEGQSETDLPYLSSGHEDAFPYDLYTSSTVSFSISQPGVPVEITVPNNIHAPA